MACLSGCIFPVIAFAVTAIVWGLPFAIGILAVLALAGFVVRLFQG